MGNGLTSHLIPQCLRMWLVTLASVKMSLFLQQKASEMNWAFESSTVLPTWIRQRLVWAPSCIPYLFLQYSQPPVSACCSVLVLSQVRLLWHFFCSLLYTSVEWLFYVGSWCCAKMVLTHFHPVSSLSFRNKAGPSGPNAGPPKQLTFPDEDRPRPSPFLVLAPAIGR